jgi:hypothetical protein
MLSLMATDTGSKGRMSDRQLVATGVLLLIAPPGSAYIPPDKSVASGLSIHQTYIDGVPTSTGKELDLVGLRGRYFVEPLACIADGERWVISLNPSSATVKEEPVALPRRSDIVATLLSSPQAYSDMPPDLRIMLPPIFRSNW